MMSVHRDVLFNPNKMGKDAEIHLIEEASDEENESPLARKTIIEKSFDVSLNGSGI